MEYSCKVGNLTALLEGSITPWRGPQEDDANLVYGTERDWAAYDRTKRQKFTGVIRETRYDKEPYGVLTLNGRLFGQQLS